MQYPIKRQPSSLIWCNQPLTFHQFPRQFPPFPISRICHTFATARCPRFNILVCSRDLINSSLAPPVETLNIVYRSAVSRKTSIMSTGGVKWKCEMWVFAAFIVDKCCSFQIVMNVVRQRTNDCQPTFFWGPLSHQLNRGTDLIAMAFSSQQVETMTSMSRWHPFWRGTQIDEWDGRKGLTFAGHYNILCWMSSSMLCWRRVLWIMKCSLSTTTTTTTTT